MKPLTLCNYINRTVELDILILANFDYPSVSLLDTLLRVMVCMKGLQKNKNKKKKDVLGNFAFWKIFLEGVRSAMSFFNNAES